MSIYPIEMIKCKPWKINVYYFVDILSFIHHFDHKTYIGISHKKRLNGFAFQNFFQIREIYSFKYFNWISNILNGLLNHIIKMILLNFNTKIIIINDFVYGLKCTLNQIQSVWQHSNLIENIPKKQHYYWMFLKASFRLVMLKILSESRDFFIIVWTYRFHLKCLYRILIYLMVLFDDMTSWQHTSHLILRARFRDYNIWWLFNRLSKSFLLTLCKV